MRILFFFLFFFRSAADSRPLIPPYEMGSQINTNARKVDFESIAFRTFDFERVLNNDSQDPDERLKIHNVLLPKSPHGT